MINNNTVIEKDKKKYIRKCVRKLITVAMALVMTISCVACDSSKSKSKGMTPGSSITPAPSVAGTVAGNNGETPTLTGVLTYLDTNGLKMHFVDISTGTEYEVPYTGGTDIQDSHEKIKAASTMSIGEIYDVYTSSSGKAVKIYGNSKVWTRNDVSGITIDESSRKISIGASNLIYESYTVVMSDNSTFNIAQIVDQDQLTLRGIDEKIYSIVVETGHGYVSLTGTDLFEGGYVTLGSDVLYGISKGMLITAPVGTYTLEVQNGSLVASKSVTVKQDETVNVDFSDVQTQSAEKGAVNFSVTPSTAVMSIDGKEVDYSSPVSLTYGTHTITLVANHYEEYTGTIAVNSAYVTKVIDMTASSTTTTTTTSANLTSGYTVSITAPEGAALYVDAAYIGIIPCSFSKSSGNKTITLTKSGYSTVSYTISIPNATGNLTYSFPDMEESTTGTTTTTTTTASSK